MGMLDALMVGGAAGAGQGLANAATQYGAFVEQQALENQRANMEVEKANRIAEHTLAIRNSDQANTGQIFNDAFKQATGFDYAQQPIDMPASQMSPTPGGELATSTDGTTPFSGSDSSAPAGVTLSASSRTKAPGIINTLLNAKNPQGMMTPEQAQNYRQGMLAGAQALLAAGKTDEAAKVMASLEATYHNMGFAGSRDTLTGETITPESERMKALAKLSGKPLSPEEQAKLKAQALEYNSKFLDTVFGDDGTYKALLASPDAVINRDTIQKQINDSRAAKVASMELANQGVPIETAASAVHAFMAGAPVVKDPKSGALGIDLGNGKALKLPLVLKNYIPVPKPNPGH